MKFDRKMLLVEAAKTKLRRPSKWKRRAPSSPPEEHQNNPPPTLSIWFLKRATRKFPPKGINKRITPQSHQHNTPSQQEKKKNTKKHPQKMSKKDPPSMLNISGRVRRQWVGYNAILRPAICDYGLVTMRSSTGCLYDDFTAGGWDYGAVNMQKLYHHNAPLTPQNHQKRWPEVVLMGFPCLCTKNSMFPYKILILWFFELR